MLSQDSKGLESRTLDRSRTTEKIKTGWPNNTFAKQPQQTEKPSSPQAATKLAMPTAPMQSPVGLSSSMHIWPTQTAWNMRRGTSCWVYRSFGHLVFYLFGPLELVFCTSSKVFLCCDLCKVKNSIFFSVILAIAEETKKSSESASTHVLNTFHILWRRSSLSFKNSKVMSV